MKKNKSFYNWDYVRQYIAFKGCSKDDVLLYFANPDIDYYCGRLKIIAITRKISQVNFYKKSEKKIKNMFELDINKCISKLR